MHDLRTQLCFKKKLFIVYLKFTFVDLEKKAKLQEK